MASIEQESRFRLGFLETPPRLYRVHYFSSQTHLYSSGLHTRNKTFDVLEEDGWKEDVWREDIWKETIITHFDWYSLRPSPFVSLFSDLNHAKNWAACLKVNHRVDPKLEDHDVEILEIDVPVLLSLTKHVYSVREMIEKGVLDWGEDHEWLVLHHIPRQAIRGPVFS